MRSWQKTASVAFILLTALALHADEPKRTNSVFVLPIIGAPSAQGADVFDGVGLQNVMEHTLVTNDSLDETWAIYSYSKLFPKFEDLERYLRGQAAEPQSVMVLQSRWVIRGRMLTPDRVSVEVEDRKTGKRSQRDLALDFPKLVRFRQSMVSVLQESGVPIAHNHDRKMLWREDLPQPAFALVGRAYAQYVYGTNDEEDLRQAIKTAPHSYVLLDNLAYVMWKQKKFDESLSLFHQALKKNRNGVDALEGLIELAAHSNLPEQARQASRLKAKVRNLPENSPDLLVELADDFARNGHLDTSIPLYESVLATHREKQDKPGEARTLSTIAFRYWLAREYKQAAEWYEKALPLQRELKDRSEEAKTLNRLGYAYQQASKTDQAVQLYQAALTIERELGDQASEADTLATLAFLYLMTDQYEQAITFYEKALPIQRDLRDRAAEAATLERLGFAYQHANQLERAYQSYELALTIQRELKDQASEARVLDEFASAYNAGKKLDKVVTLREQALAILRALKDRAGEAQTLSELGLAYWNVNQTDQAMKSYEQALVIERDLKDQKSEVETLEIFGLFDSAHKEYAKAADCYQKAATLRHSLHDRPQEAKALDRLADSYRNAKQTEQAVAAYQQELAILRELKDQSRQATVLHDIGYSYEQSDQYDKAIPFYEEVAAIRHELPDKSAEASAHYWLGSAYRHERQFDKALQQHEQQRAQRWELKDRSGEASAIHDLGFIYDDEKEFEKAIACYEQELVILREIKERKLEAWALRALGQDAKNLHQYEKALGYYEQALAIQRDLQDREEEGRTLNEIGIMHAALGHYDKELLSYREAVTIARETKNRSNEGVALFALASTYLRLAQFQEAIQYLEQALAIAHQENNRLIERSTLMALGIIYGTDPAQGEKGIAYLDQALSLNRAAHDRENEGRALLLQGIAYVRLNQLEKAIANFQTGLAIAREQKDDISQALALQLAGHVCILLKRYDVATVALDQALTIARRVGIHEAEAPILGEMMINWSSRNQPLLAIMVGKQSVNILQELRSTMRTLDPILQQGFMQKNATTYRYLANLLAAQGRLAEAQQVLDLQKQDEFSTFVQRDNTMSPAQGAAPLTAQESDWIGRYREINDRLTGLGLKRGELLMKTGRTPAEETELAQLERDLEVGNRAFQSFLDQMDSALRSSKGGGEEVAKVRDAEGLMETLRDLGPGTVAVYTVFGDDGVRLILITPDVQKGYFTQISASALNSKILEFRQAVRSPATDPRPLAKELFDILIKPMEKDLEGAAAQTIMWSLDGPLRYVPVPALYDGRHYVVERYRSVVFTPASRSRLKDPVSRDWRGLGLGVSLAHEGFQALPNVPSELHAIIRDNSGSARGILPGTVELDGDFTEERLRTELRRHYSIVHLASHFDFIPGTDRQSFLLLGDGSKLTLEEFRAMPQILQGVELLTLSACDTAVGGEDADGKEVEGFAVLAQRQGAKAVVATLWAVADESTSLLMKEFYRLRMSDQAITKAEALRQAQLALLTGKIRGTVSAGRGASRENAATTLAVAPQAPYAHPYFWAPFVLMGNWK